MLKLILIILLGIMWTHGETVHVQHALEVQTENASLQEMANCLSCLLRKGAYIDVKASQFGWHFKYDDRARLGSKYCLPLLNWSERWQRLKGVVSASGCLTGNVITITRPLNPRRNGGVAWSVLGGSDPFELKVEDAMRRRLEDSIFQNFNATIVLAISLKKHEQKVEPNW